MVIRIIAPVENAEVMEKWLLESLEEHCCTGSFFGHPEKFCLILKKPTWRISNSDYFR